MLGRKYRNHSPFLLCFVTIFMEKYVMSLTFLQKNAFFDIFAMKCDKNVCLGKNDG